jgi:hypothetical protein
MIEAITEVINTLFGLGTFLAIIFMIVGIVAYYYEKYTKHKNKQDVSDVPRNTYKKPPSI